MKTTKPFPLNHAQLLELFHNLTIPDCRHAIGILTHRIEKYENEKLINEAKRQRPENFLDSLLSEYNLSTYTKNQLAKNGITTVRQLTEIGFDTLLLLRHFGPRTVQQIKEALFGDEQKNKPHTRR